MTNSFEKTELCDVDDFEEDYSISPDWMSKFSNTDNFTEVVGLFLFYYKTARWQKTQRTRISVEDIRDRTGLGINKITKIRKQLIRLGAIKTSPIRNSEGKFIGQITHVMIRWKGRSTPSEPSKKTKPLSKSRFKRTIQYPDLPSQESKIKSPHKSKKSKLEISQRYYPQAKQLAEIVMDHINKQITKADIRKWCLPIRELALQGVTTQRMNKLLDWYSKYIGEEYVHVIHSGRSFKEKFTDLEANIKNWDNKEGRKLKQNFKEHRREELNPNIVYRTLINN